MRVMKRDRAILQHLSRYRMTTNEVIQRLFFPRQKPNAVTKVTARLTERGLLRQFPLYHPRNYFTLGDEGVAVMGLPPGRAEGLGPQSLPIEFGVLNYALLGAAQHQRLTRDELVKRYPFFGEGTCEQTYTECDGVLELVRVDLGGAADHVARKCFRDISQRSETNGFVALLRENRFRLVVVTCTKEKAAAISNALSGHLWPDGLMIHLAVVPDLLYLTARLIDAS